MTALSFDILGRDKASAAFDKIGKKADETGRKFGFLAQRTHGFTAGISLGFGKVAAAMGGIAIGGFAKDVVGLEATFSQTMNTMAAVAKVPQTQVKSLSDLAIKMGKDTTFSASEAANAMLELAKGGLSAATIQSGALQGTLTLAAAGGTDMATAATIASNALNTFSLKGSDMASVAAALAGGANASSASVESLGEALGQVGPGAKTAGLSLQDTVGILAAFDNAGIKGTDAGTSLKTMLTRLVPSTDQAKNAMKDLGLKFTDAHGKFLPITSIAQQLKDKLTGLSDEQRTLALSTIFGSDATRAATVLMKEGATGIAKYITATKDQNAAQDVASARMKGTAGAIESFKGSLETAKLQLGLFIAPAVQGGLGLLTKGVNGIGPAFAKLSPFLKTAKDGIKSLFDLVVKGDFTSLFRKTFHVDEDSPVVELLLKFKGAFFQFRDAVVNVGATVAPLLKELGQSGLGGLKLLGVALFGLAKGLVSGVIPAFKSFTGFLEEHGTVVRSVLVGIGAMVLAVKAYQLALVVGGAAVKAYTVATVILDKVMKLSTFGIIATAIIGIAAALIYAYHHSEKFRDIVNTIGGALKTAFVGVVGFVKDTIKFFGDLPGNIAAAIGDAGAWLLQKGKDFFQGLVNGIWSIAQGIDKWMLRAPVAKLLAPWYGIAKWLIPHGVKFIGGLIGGIASAAKSIGSWLLRNVIAPALSMFAKSGQWLVQGGKNMVAGLVAGVSAFLSGIKGIGTWIYNKVIVPAVTPFAKAAAWLTSAGSHLIGGMLGGIVTAMKGIGSWIKSNIIDPVVNAVKKFFGIASPSKVFAEIGGHLIGGLFKGMGSGVGGAIAKKVFGDMPAALRSIVGKGLISVKNLPKKALDALGGAVGVGDPIGGRPGNQSNVGVVRTLASQYGWGSGAQWDALYNLIMGESGFRNTAQNPTSSAYGIFQFLDSTWGSVGASKTSDPWAQTIAGLKYIAGSYGSPANAYAKWSARSPHWYGDGGLITETVLGIGLKSGKKYGFGERGTEVVTPMHKIPRAAGGSGRVVLEFRSDGTPHMDYLIKEFRKYVKVNGGNVQMVLGRG